MSIADSFVFEDADLPMDSSPPNPSVEFPCAKCGEDVGYGGRGRKPTPRSLCKSCKPSGRSGVRVTGSANNLAVQAAKTLVQANGFVAMGLAAMSFFKSAGTVAAYQEQFEAQAHAALLTDPELCKTILRAGGTSAKFSLTMCYVGMGIAVGPSVMEELKDRKATRLAEMDPDYATGS